MIIIGFVLSQIQVMVIFYIILESSHDDIMKKLNSTNIDIVDETNLKNIQENIKEFQKSFDVLSNQKQVDID